MTLINTPYFNLECNGPARTLLDDHCSTKSRGSWDKEEMLAAAEARGWTLNGRNNLCPECSADAAPPAEAAAPARKTRSRGKDTPVDAAGAGEQTWDEAQAS